MNTSFVVHTVKLVMAFRSGGSGFISSCEGMASDSLVHMDMGHGGSPSFLLPLESRDRDDVTMPGNAAFEMSPVQRLIWCWRATQKLL